jgi:hypothetical protein
MLASSAESALLRSLVFVFQRKLCDLSAVSLFVFSQTRFAAEVSVSISYEKCDWVTVDLLSTRVTSEPDELTWSDSNVRIIFHNTRHNIVGER